MSNPNDYTVGWICAITTEYVAARAILDERHEGPETISNNDNNNYSLGRIGKHNVVIAILPIGEYGIAPAARVATDLSHSFPNVRFGLLVGVGGGAPTRKHDIRLGDVVVSSPGSSNGGVFQYDFGKTIQGQSFQATAFLNQPPSILRAAITGLKAKYEEEGCRFKATIGAILDRNPRLRKKYQQPDPSSDRLYQSYICHPGDEESDCAASCGDSWPALIVRPERTEEDDDPLVHYGLIASANQLMEDPVIRDRLAAEKDVKCFEMEAAGLMNHFPCLVIRGICHYSDSHKNEGWQGYAAIVAAVYAKDLLNRIPPNRIEAEKKISEILSKHLDIAKEHLEVAKEHRDITKSHFQRHEEEKIHQQEEDERRREEEKHRREEEKRRQEEEKRRQEEEKLREECHQLFRLTKSDKDDTYEWYKNRVQERAKDTCLWFLNHKHFQAWLQQDSGPLLVSADPGCGKSVLARFLVDKVLPREETSICYFFFKDQDQNTAQQALCALLHQLFIQKPCLIEHVIPYYRNNGSKLIYSTTTLWRILQNSAEDPQAGSVIMVLDALDECAESEFPDLIRNVESQFRSVRRGKLKYLLTCRPYEAVISEFHDLLRTFPKIRIPGEEESEAISQEINHVIQHRLNQLSEKKGLSSEIKSYLQERLQETTNRTYLWAYLIFDYLNKEDFKKTLQGVKSTLTILPRSVNEAYEQILNKSKDDPMVRKTLSIIFAARRPLTVAEMNVAVNIDISLQALDLEKDDDFTSRLRSLCGLFISIYHGKVYFLHQTARDFLQQSSSPAVNLANSQRWQHSISMSQAHSVLLECCQNYIILISFEIDGQFSAAEESSRFLDEHAFLRYSAKYWANHFQKSGASNMPSPKSILEPIMIKDLYKRLDNLIINLPDFYRHRPIPKHTVIIALSIAKLVTASIPGDFKNLAILLSGMGTRFHRHYLETSDLEDLSESIRISSDIISIAPLSHPDYAVFLRNLGRRLYSRYLRAKSTEDLDEAVRVLNQANITLSGYQDWTIFVNDLGYCTYNERSHHDLITNIEKAIYISLATLDVPSLGSQDRAMLLIKLGNLLDNKCSLTGSILDFDDYQESAVFPPPQQYTPFKSSFERSGFPSLYADIIDEPYPSSAAFENLVDATALALHANREPLVALQYLEISRDFVRGAMRQRRDISTLAKSHPEAAHSFLNLRGGLDSPPSPTIDQFAEARTTVMRAGPDQRHKANQELTLLLSDIRSKPGFDRFLLLASEAEMLDCAKYGPVVILNVSRYRCDALIIEHSGIGSLHLPEASEAIIDDHSRDPMTDTALEWLWDAIVSPVLNTLGFEYCPPGHQLPRIWWVPTRNLINMPLHAAGYHFDGSAETALDRVVSSYASSVQAIVRNRRNQRLAPGRAEVAHRLVTVAMDDTPEWPPLYSAGREVDSISDVLNPVLSSHSQPLPRKKNVLSALETCSIFHFAGHCKINSIDPFQSSLLLADWEEDPLTAASLLDVNIDTEAPFLAYLSTCGCVIAQGAYSPQAQKGYFLKEYIPLSEAFQLAGFPHVIGTIGEVDDELCADMATLIYKYLRDEGLRDESVSRALHNATRKVRDQWERTARNYCKLDGSSKTARGFEGTAPQRYPNPWASYVHFGI